MSRKLLNFFNELVTIAVALVLLLMGAYSGYALWDNERIYASAENVQADMIRLKPEVVVEETEEGWTGPSFEQLLAINPDVRGWVSTSAKSERSTTPPGATPRASRAPTGQKKNSVRNSSGRATSVAQPATGRIRRAWSTA